LVLSAASAEDVLSLEPREEDGGERGATFLPSSLTAAAAEPEPSIPGILPSPDCSTPEGGGGEANSAGAARGAPVVKAAFGLVLESLLWFTWTGSSWSFPGPVAIVAPGGKFAGASGEDCLVIRKSEEGVEKNYSFVNREKYGWLFIMVLWQMYSLVYLQMYTPPV
jgi:hypothetical protein